MAQTTEPVPNKKNKALPFLAISFAIALFYVLFLRQQLSNQEQLLVSFESQVDSLISDIEDASRQRLKLENHLEELQRQLRDENDRLVSANQLLNEAEAKVDPDYDELEAAIRARLQRENAREQYLSPEEEQLALIKSLATLSQEELGTVMSLQAEYGGFLEALNVPDERMSSIITALQRMVQDRQTTMRDMMERNMAEMQQAITNGEAPNRAARRGMGEELARLNSLDNQVESLSYDLTESELALFQEIQSEQQNQAQQIMRGFRGGPGAASIIQAMPITGSVATQNLDIQVGQDGGGGSVSIITGFSSIDEVTGEVIETEDIVILDNNDRPN